MYSCLSGNVQSKAAGSPLPPPLVPRPRRRRARPRLARSALFLLERARLLERVDDDQLLVGLFAVAEVLAELIGREAQRVRHPAVVVAAVAVAVAIAAVVELL